MYQLFNRIPVLFKYQTPYLPIIITHNSINAK